MRSIVRCNPGEGESPRAHLYLEFAEAAPHPDPLPAKGRGEGEVDSCADSTQRHRDLDEVEIGGVQLRLQEAGPGDGLVSIKTDDRTSLAVVMHRVQGTFRPPKYLAPEVQRLSRRMEVGHRSLADIGEVEDKAVLGAETGQWVVWGACKDYIAILRSGIMRDHGTQLIDAISLGRGVAGILRDHCAQRGRGSVREHDAEARIVGDLRIDNTIMLPSDRAQLASEILRDHLDRLRSRIMRDHGTQLVTVALEPDVTGILRDHGAQPGRGIMRDHASQPRIAGARPVDTTRVFPSHPAP